MEEEGAKKRRRVSLVLCNPSNTLSCTLTFISASLARTLSERLRGEATWLVTEVDRAAKRAQQDSNFR